MKRKQKTEIGKTVILESSGYSGADDIRHTEWDFPNHFRQEPLYPVLIEESLRSNVFRFKVAYCRYFYFSILTKGKIEYQHMGRTYVLDSHSMLITPSGCNYSFVSGLNGPYHKLVLELSGLHHSSICSALGLNKFQLVPLDNHDEVCQYFLSVRDTLARRDPGDIPGLLGGLYEFLVKISDLVGRQEKNPDLLSQALFLLESPLNPNLQIPEIASRLGISVSTLNRMFRERLNISPIHYRNAKLIEQAKNMLEHSTLSLKEISSELGFCNLFYFSQQFRRIQGCSPREYRRQMQQKS